MSVTWGSDQSQWLRRGKDATLAKTMSAEFSGTFMVQAVPGHRWRHVPKARFENRPSNCDWRLSYSCWGWNRGFWSNNRHCFWKNLKIFKASKIKHSESPSIQVKFPFNRTMCKLSQGSIWNEMTYKNIKVQTSADWTSLRECHRKGKKSRWRTSGHTFHTYGPCKSSLS